MISAAILLASVAVAVKPLSALWDWFTAERGAGEGRNGWV